MDMSRITVIDHPLVQHKLSFLRDKNTSSSDFRLFVNELAMFEGYKATEDIQLDDVEIETPLEKTTQKRIIKQPILIVPIMRAGIALCDGLLKLIPSAHVGHLGMYRDEETHKPIAYFDKMPKNIEQHKIIICDPMLATGGSAAMAIEYFRNKGIKEKLTLMVLVSAPEGLEYILNFDDNVHIITCAIDDRLDENCYIRPGLGDAGDRIYGTK